MIDLTPLDVRKKKEDFRRTVRGYDPSQVDAFLDLVADRLEDLVHEHRTLTEKVAVQEERLTAYREREHALNEAMLAAQELREEARVQTERESALRLREVEVEAEAVRERAEQAVRRSGERLEELRVRRAQFVRGLRATLERFMEELAVEEERIAAERYEAGPAGGPEAAPAAGDRTEGPSATAPSGGAADAVPAAEPAQATGKAAG
ncbi:MAG: DivIVA domain-containing protein [Gemmatimonadota bacterium]